MTAESNTGADALVEALATQSIRYIFGNFGSDHAGIIQSLGSAKLAGRDAPEVILCPHEIVAASAAHGYAQATGEAQAVFVHCDVGTANLGGTLHNAARCRVPMYVFAGATPFTLHAELPGTRNREANYSQDVFDQASIVRPYVKWNYELRTAKNIKQVVRRALEISRSAPPGPVYMVAAREVLEEAAGKQENMTLPVVEPIGLTGEQLTQVLNALTQAERPLIVTTYSGRHPEAVGELVTLAEQTCIPVLELRATDMNFPGDHLLRLDAGQADAVEVADVILVLDCELPWLPLKSGKITATTLIIDKDPIKEQLPLWEIPAAHYFRADSLTVLRQLNALCQTEESQTRASAGAATPWITGQKPSSDTPKTPGESDTLTAASPEEPNAELTAETVFTLLNQAISAEAVIVDEAVTNSGALRKHVRRTQPGTFYSNGGTSLGWSLGASIGIRLAHPDRQVITVIGDGAYLLACPAAAYWTAKHAGAPFLTLIMNNRGWNATKQNMLRLYPDSAAGDSIGYLSRLSGEANLAAVAEATGGAWVRVVATRHELADALPQALNAINEGQCAVLDIRLPTI